jgi:hypothetical protein
MDSNHAAAVALHHMHYNLAGRIGRSPTRIPRSGRWRHESAITSGPATRSRDSWTRVLNVRRRPAGDVLFVVAGVWAFVVAALRLANNNDYLPSDLRSQPWFDPLVNAIFVLIGLFLIAFGAVRMIRAGRRRHH